MRACSFVLISSHQILRQFEALMGGSPHAPRQDTASSSQQATTNPLSSSTHSDPLQPTHPADNASLNKYQLDVSPTGVTQPPNPPSPPSSLALADKDSSGELMNDGEEERLSPVQNELVHNHVEPVSTVEEESEPHTDRCSSTPAEPQCEQPCMSRLSLFSGMELVTKGRPLCKRETSQIETDTTDDSLRENPAVHNSISIRKTSDDAPSVCNSAASDGSQPVSAFSFLNF